MIFNNKYLLFHITLITLLIVGLTACSLLRDGPSSLLELNETPATQSPVNNTATAITKATPQATNLALGRDIIASAFLPDEKTENAIDGNPDSVWNAGSHPPQWIQIDLGGNATINEIRLTVAQYPTGKVIHQIFAGHSPTTLELVNEFSETTSDGQVLVFKPTQMLTDTRYIKILTTLSPSFTAWRDISIMGWLTEEENVPLANNLNADLILYNGVILTMVESAPIAEAIAIKGDKILATGSTSAVMEFKGEGTQLFDLKGLTLTPGFIDSHSHRIGDRWQFGDVSAEAMMDKAIRQGWTSIHELFVNDQRLDELVTLAQADMLPLRVSMYLTMNFHEEYTTWWKAYQPLQNFGPYLQIAGLKVTLDQEWGKTIFFDQDELNQMVMDGQQLGWQIAAHSFTIVANELILNAFANVSNLPVFDNSRHRIEHIGVINDDQIGRMADMGILGSVQFINASSWIQDETFNQWVHKEDIQLTSRWRDLINAGVFLIGNTDDPWCCTDWINGFKLPPEEATVVEAISQGVTRIPFNGKSPEIWQLNQAVTTQEALEMLTINGAYAAHQEKLVGSLEPGKLADMVILSNNPLTVPVEDLAQIEVLMTMVGGIARYCSTGFESLCEIK